MRLLSTIVFLAVVCAGCSAPAGPEAASDAAAKAPVPKPLGIRPAGDETLSPDMTMVKSEDLKKVYAYIDEHGARIRIPADLTAAQASSVQLLALQTFRALEGSGLARVDFFLSKEGRLFVNEINTLPGFTAISMYPKLWEASGIPARGLVERLIEIAIERGKRRSRLRTTA